MYQYYLININTESFYNRVLEVARKFQYKVNYTWKEFKNSKCLAFWIDGSKVTTAGFGSNGYTVESLEELTSLLQKIEDENNTYTLELTSAEAKTLLTILNAVGGSPECSPRKYARDIRHALVRQNVVPYGSGEAFEAQFNTLMFKNF